MRRVFGAAAVLAAASLLVAAVALAQSRVRRPAPAQVVVAQGTEVLLAFDRPLSSRTARVGDRVQLHVSQDVVVGDRVLLRAGLPVTAVVSRIDKRKAFGVNADIRLALNPVRSPAGLLIPLQPRTQGSPVGGEKSAQAAGATAGGAIVLGPVGLVGGYFVKGKPVDIKAGDQFDTEIARALVLRGRQVTRLPAARPHLAALPTDFYGYGDPPHPPAARLVAVEPMNPQHPCMPNACTPVRRAAALPAVQLPTVQSPSAGWLAPLPAAAVSAPLQTASAAGQGLQCPVPVVVAPPVAAATAPVFQEPGGKQCAGFADLPTARDHGFSC